MAQKGSQFLQYIIPILKVLQRNGGTVKASEVIDQVIKDLDIIENDLAETTSSGESKIRNQMRWARFYLHNAGY